METLLTLDQAAALIPGADADTLKRRIRQGKLLATRPGKAYLTTRAAVQDMIEACRVAPRVRVSGSAPPAGTPPAESPTSPLGLSSTDLANAALDSALAQAKPKKTKR